MEIKKGDIVRLSKPHHTQYGKDWILEEPKIIKFNTNYKVDVVLRQKRNIYISLEGFKFFHPAKRFQKIKTFRKIKNRKNNNYA